MAQPLAAFQGRAIYLDAVILAGYMDAVSPWHLACRQFFARAIDPAAPIRMVTASLAVDETIFVLLEESVQRPPYGVMRSRSQYLRSHPQVVRQLMTTLDAPVQDMLSLVQIEEVSLADITAMRQEMLTYGLLPRDAIYVAVMRRLGITAVASDDDDFERCAGIALYKP